MIQFRTLWQCAARGPESIFDTLIPALLAIALMVPLSLVAQERQFAVSGFEAVRFSGVGELHVRQSHEESLSVNATAEALEALTVDVDHGVLYIDVDTRMELRGVPRFALEVKGLTEISAFGSGRVHVDGLDGRHLFVDAHGSTAVVLQDLVLQELNSSSAGSGEFTVAGRVHRQVVNLAGASRYQAEELASNFGEVNIQGAANARVAVAEVLDVVVSGAGSVEYIGSPRVYESVRGAGRIASYKREPGG